MRTIVSFFLIGAAIAGWIFIFQPEWTRALSLRQDVAGVRALRNELKELIAKRDALYQEYQAIPAADVARLLAIAPESPETRDMIVAVEALANQSDVILKQIEFSPPAGGGTGAASAAFAAVPVSFSIEGTYDGLLAFLKNVERNTRLIDVTDFAFSEFTPAQRLTFSIRGKMYYRR